MVSAKAPADIESERALLGSMMDRGGEAVSTVCRSIQDDCEEWLTIPAHWTVYRGLVDDWRRGVSFDLILFTGKLRDSQLLDGIGGAAFVTGLFTMMIPASSATFYLDRLADKRWLRHVLRIGAEISSAALDHQDDVSGVMRTVESSLLRIASRDGKAKSRNVKQIVATVIDNLIDTEKILGISTGFPNLDEVVGGLAEGAKIVLAGPISGGKSAFAQCMADSLAVTRAIPTAIFSFEMTADQVAQRLIQIRSETSVRSIARQEAELFAVDAFNIAAQELAGAPLWIIDERLDIAGIRSRCLQLKPRVAIIDYLQIVPERKQRGENTTDKLDRMSAETKQIAHDLGLTVIELSQLTTDEKSGKSKTRGSSGITADSDQLWIIEGEDDEAKTTIPKQITIAKQRDGGRKAVPFTFVKPITKFRQRK